MRQVPPKLALYGRGRVATQFARYFEIRSLSFVQQSRTVPLSQAFKAFADCDVLLLAIKDDAMSAFWQEARSLWGNKAALHFSGSQSIEGLSAFHPVYAFSNRMLEISELEKIPFVLSGSLSWEQVFPTLSNPHLSIPAQNRVLYHALLAAAANLPILLWQRALKDLQQNFDIPFDFFLRLLGSALKNFEADPATALSGPLARKDFQALQKHLTALRGHPFAEFYQTAIKDFSISLSQENP